VKSEHGASTVFPLRPLFLIISFLSIFVTAAPASALEQVTLQLKWLHQFQFAGYYAAVQQGYYHDAGLNVTIVPATPGKDPVQQIITGKAEYGVGSSSLLLQRNAGKPVVTLAVIFQHSPNIILTKERSPSQTIHSLVGKRLMLRPQADELLAYLTKEGIPMQRLDDQSYTVQDLINGRADAISGYITNEPETLKRAGFPYHAYTPRSAGIDFYGDTLFTTEDELHNHSARAKAFREASLKGWHYALQHQEELINLIISTYAPHSDRAHLKYEAEQIRQLIQPELVEIGYMHEGRWRHIADIYNELGMLPKNIELKPFLYDPHPTKNMTPIYWVVSTMMALAMLVMAVRLIISSRSLKSSEEQIRQQYNDIRLSNEMLEEQVLERTGELQKTNEYEQLRSHTLGMLAEDVPLADILEDIVWGVEQINPAMLCSILLLDSDGKHLGRGVAPSLPDFYNAAINGLEIGLGVGSCGTAAFTGERVIVSDIATHPYWAPYTELAARAGLGACWSQPILSSSGQVLGTFAIYHREARSPDQPEITIIEQAANLASIAIDKSNLSEALHDSELRFRSFVENANDVLFSLTQEGSFEYVSPQWSIAFGYEPGETIGHLFSHFVHPDDFPNCVTFMQQAFTTGEKQSGVEYRVLCKDGRYVWYTANASPVTDPVTAALTLVGIGRDITERKQTEEALRKSEELYHSLVETSQDLIWQCDTDGRYTYLNLAWEQVFGYELHVMLGRKFSDFQRPENAERDLTLFKQVLDGHSVQNYESTHIGRSGNEIHLVFNALYICDETDEIIGASGTAYNITQRKQVEKELRQAKEAAETANYRLSLATEAGGVGIWEYDLINNKLVWDDQMHLLYGLPTDAREVSYSGWVALLHPDDVLFVDTAVRLALSGEKEYETEFRVIWPDYSLHTLSAAGTVQRDASGQPVRMVGTNWDITRIKRAEEDIHTFSRQLKEKNSELNAALIATEQANSAKSRFLSNMSHEFRTPLNAIIGFSALALKTTLKPRQYDYIGKIHTAGELLLNISNDILDFSKIEAGKLTLEQIPFRPAIMIENVVSMVQQKAREKTLTLQVKVAPEIAAYLVGDPHRLVQIIANLLSNAVKFTEQGKITLEISLLHHDADREQLKFSVRDTGIGLSHEQITRLFQPFTQADESTTRRFGGTGLGLSISKQLVELMGGAISCESTPGTGSCFSFTAWLGICHADESTPVQPVVDTVTKVDFTGYRILLVEDNKTNRQLVIELLSDSGAAVAIAVNGEEAVRMVTGDGASVYDLVLMDIQMPVMDGYEATRLIREDERFTSLPIVAMTAHVMAEEKQKILRSGMDAHIAKPIDVCIMLQVISSFFHELPVCDLRTENRDYDSMTVMSLHTDTMLDVTGALNRLDGNEKIYLWLLNSFVENKADMVTAIQDALRTEDNELAARHAHTLKSSAGTIGAVEMEELARLLETAIACGEPQPTIASRLEQCAAEMIRLVAFMSAANIPVLIPAENQKPPHDC
jgi:PAS domain S-box-containing protein